MHEEHKNNHTGWFADEARPPIASEPYITGPFGMSPVIATPSLGVCVKGVDGCELNGPTVFPVLALLWLFYQRTRKKRKLLENHLTK